MCEEIRRVLLGILVRLHERKLDEMRGIVGWRTNHIGMTVRLYGRLLGITDLPARDIWLWDD